MKTLYIDAFSGISGDMMLGALLDIGGDEQVLRRSLAALGIMDEVTLHIQRTQRNGITGTAAHVHLIGHKHDHDDTHDHDHSHDHDHKHDHEHSHDHQHSGDGGHENHTAAAHAHRGFSEIASMISASSLSETVKTRATAMFRRLGEAEAAVHGIDLEQVHFHEVGAADALVDIVGCCVLLENLGIGHVTCSPVALGGGSVRCAHGVLPVPAPATARLLLGVPAYGGEAHLGELTTPTGATIVTALSSAFGPMPAMRMTQTGYGFGQRDTGSLNALRLMLGDACGATEAVYELRANLDDMTGEALSFASGKLFDAGALDVWTQAIGMKKGRPGVMLCALAPQTVLDAVLSAYTRHTCTWGVRYTPVSRLVCPRECVTLSTAYGEIRVKAGAGRYKPEYDDCARACEEYAATMQQVHDAVHTAWRAYSS